MFSRLIIKEKYPSLLEHSKALTYKQHLDQHFLKVVVLHTLKSVPLSHKQKLQLSK